MSKGTDNCDLWDRRTYCDPGPWGWSNLIIMEWKAAFSHQGPHVWPSPGVLMPSLPLTRLAAHETAGETSSWPTSVVVQVKFRWPGLMFLWKVAGDEKEGPGLALGKPISESSFNYSTIRRPFVLGGWCWRHRRGRGPTAPALLALILTGRTSPPVCRHWRQAWLAQLERIHICFVPPGDS